MKQRSILWQASEAFSLFIAGQFYTQKGLD